MMENVKNFTYRRTTNRFEYFILIVEIRLRVHECVKSALTPYVLK